MKLDSKILTQKQYLKQITAACSSVVPQDETVYIALKGAFKEYLICTNKMVYIIKSGFMTGHTFGLNDFKMPYNSITNAQVSYHVLSGYFELSAGGLQNKHYNYWSSDKNNAPQQQPNVISVTGKSDAELFRKASKFILGKSAQTGSSGSGADELKKYADLYKQGYLTKAEFDAKKRELL